MLFHTSNKVTDAGRAQGVAEVLENAKPDSDFYILVVGAILLAASGILLDSIPVLIASMVVAPLMWPILGLSLGINSGDTKLIGRSLSMLVISMIVALGVSALGAHIALQYFGWNLQGIFISFSPNYFFDVFIAVISGAIAAYGLVRTKVGGAMTGIGIAVSLMPPLVATGIGLVTSKILSESALMIFALNVLGILIASCITFAILKVKSK